MTSLLVFAAIAALSVLASNQRLLEAGRFVALAQLSASGLLFLALGAAVGPHALALLKPNDVDAVQPLVALGLGLGGVLIGINLDLRVLRRLPASVYAAAFAQSLAAFIVVAAPLSVVLWLVVAHRPLGAAGAASLLGAAAAVSSGHIAVLWSRTGRMDRAAGLSISVLAMLDDLTGIGVLAVALVLGAAATVPDGLGLICVAALIGLLCGALLAFLIRTAEEGELMAVLLGGVAFVAGAAAYLRISALITGVACGAALSLVGGRKVELIYRTLARIERPAYLMLVFLIGVHLDTTRWLTWLIVPVFVSLRFLGKIAGGALAGRFAGNALALPARPGFALLAQGGVALCVVMEYASLVRSELSQLVFAVGVVAVVVNEVLATRAFRYSVEAKA